MNPYFFGSSRSPLYGVHHPPRIRTVVERGVVLCPPFGQEYMRSHRAFRQLANLLARRGLQVLRFDYSCTGDSAGQAEDASLDQWLADIGIAIQELRESTGLERVSLVGLRLGAALAAAAAARSDIERLVLWDPVLNGRAYLEEVTAAAGMPGTAQTRETLGLRGFPLTAAFRDAVSAIDVPSLSLPGDLRVLLVTGGARADVSGLAGSWAASRRHVTREEIPSPGDWNELDYYGSALVPQAVIRAIVDWLSGQVADA